MVFWLSSSFVTFFVLTLHPQDLDATMAHCGTINSILAKDRIVSSENI